MGRQHEIFGFWASKVLDSKTIVWTDFCTTLTPIFSSQKDYYTAFLISFHISRISIIDKKEAVGL